MHLNTVHTYSNWMKTTNRKLPTSSCGDVLLSLRGLFHRRGPAAPRLGMIPSRPRTSSSSRKTATIFSSPTSKHGKRERKPRPALLQYAAPARALASRHPDVANLLAPRADLSRSHSTPRTKAIGSSCARHGKSGRGPSTLRSLGTSTARTA